MRPAEEISFEIAMDLFEPEILEPLEREVILGGLYRISLKRDGAQAFADGEDA